MPVQRILLGFAYLLIGLFISPLLTGLALFMLVVVAYALRTVVEEGEDLGERVAEKNEEIQSLGQSGVFGLKDVKLFNIEDYLEDEFDSEVEEWADVQTSIAWNRGILSNYTTLLTGLTSIVVVYTAIRILSLEFGMVVAFLVAMVRLSPIVSNLNNRIYDIESDVPHLTRCQRFLELTSDKREAAGSGAEIDTVEEVRFEEVCFSYRDGPRVLDDVSFRAENGESIAFVGESGEGKSTIVSLVARLHEPDDGEILVNDTPASDIALDSLRERISFVPQDPYIFNDTMWRNLTIGRPDASKEEVKKACRIAEVDEFLDELENGYDTALGDDGTRLSGGQRQRVAIARALVKPGDVLVLDEATSELDSNIEQQVIRSLEDADDDVLTISIAHRLSSIKHADRIYVVKDGTISTAGTHERLLDSENKYSELYSIQREN